MANRSFRYSGLGWDTYRDAQHWQRVVAWLEQKRACPERVRLSLFGYFYLILLNNLSKIRSSRWRSMGAIFLRDALHSRPEIEVNLLASGRR
jgi:hypothetical protein